jgi:lysophospholipase
MKLVALPRNPVPSGAIVGAFAGYDGAPLRFARWQATRGPARGTVCLFGGRGEFIEKYFEVVADLRRRGFAVASMDWRGQGLSWRALANRRKGHIVDFAEHERDLLRFMKDIVLPDCPPPLIGLAHSMGGNILLRTAARPGCWFDRLVMTAPMIALSDEKVGYPQPLARAYAEIASALGFGSRYVYGGSDRCEEMGDFADNPLTSDFERWSRNKAVLETEPALGLGAPTIAWLRAAYRTCAVVAAPEFAQRVDVPVLMFAAGRDRIVSTRAIEDLGVGLKLGTPLLIPGARHEILQETDLLRQRFWAAFDAYLGVDAHVG